MVHEIALTSSFEGKLLGINLNSKLKKHMTDICNKVIKSVKKMLCPGLQVTSLHKK